MMRISLFLVVIGALTASCKNSSKRANESEKLSNAGQSTNCYLAITNQDTISLHITTADSVVTGDLAYKFHEKDRNEGTIQGRMEGDLLVADYSFESEGVTSVRQVAFRKTEEGFVEGYGDMEEKDGKMVFKNIQTLGFYNGLSLKQIPCAT